MSQSEMDRHFNSRRALKKRIEELSREVTYLRRVEQTAREAIREHNCGDIEACYVCGPLDAALSAPAAPKAPERGACPVCHGTGEVRDYGSAVVSCPACAPAAPKEEAK